MLKGSLIPCLILVGDLYLSGMGIGVDPRTDTKMTCVHKRVWSMRSNYGYHSKLIGQSN